MKKFFSILLSISLLLSVNTLVLAAPEALNLAPDTMQAAPLNDAYVNYLENPESFGGVIPAPYAPVIDNSTATVTMAVNDIIPDKYDPRDQSSEAALPLPAIRNQGGEGDCWAFGATAAYEISNIKNIPGTQYDASNILSESHMAASLYNQTGSWAPWTFNLSSGGNREMSTAYYMRGSGPVLDSSFPQSHYQSHDFTYDEVVSLKQTEQVENIIYITDGDAVTDDDRAAIKNAIMTYGAVSASYRAEENDSSSSKYTKYYNSKTFGYYYNGTEPTNHAITLVGWDDNFSKNDFGTEKPPGNGAWIMRNSWGSGRGDAGYEYVSYYDIHIGKSATAFDGKTDTSDHIYQYDLLGQTGVVSFEWSTDTWVANRFQSNSETAETLDSIGVFVYQTDTVVKLMVDTTVAQGSPAPDNEGLSYLELEDSDDPSDPISKTFRNPGYYQIKLRTPLQISDRFDVMVNFTLTNGGRVIVPTEATGWYDADERDLCKNVVINSGESFIGTKQKIYGKVKNGYYTETSAIFENGWSDLNTSFLTKENTYFLEDGTPVSVSGENGPRATKPGNACIKAYTSTVAPVPPEPLELTGQQSNDTNTFIVTVQKNSGTVTTASLLIAAYDAKGALLTSTVSDVDFSTQDTFTSGPVSFDENASYYKAFLWDSTDGLQPLCQPLDKQPLVYHQ